MSERITAQGVDSRFYNPNLSISKVINKRLNIFANWNNIDMGLLKSNEQAIDTWQNNFYTHTNYIYEVDVIKVGISYKMNQFGNNKFRKGEFGDQEF